MPVLKSYFVPDELTTRTLTDAMKRDVKVRIIVSGDNTHIETVRSVSRATWGSLLGGGAVIAEYKPTIHHGKVLIVGRVLVSVGSTNFDNRSFRLNDKATLNIFDATFAIGQTKIFDADLPRSRPIANAEWRARPLRDRVAERFASIIASQL